MLQNYCTPISNNHKQEASFVCKDCLVHSWLIPPGATFIMHTQKNNCVWMACCCNQVSKLPVTKQPWTKCNFQTYCSRDSETCRMHSKINCNLHTCGEETSKSKKRVTLYKQYWLGNLAVKSFCLASKEEECSLSNYLRTWPFKMDHHKEHQEFLSCKFALWACKAGCLLFFY